MSKCDVIIPVGPGHADTAELAARSVEIAALLSTRFTTINTRMIDDSHGKFGRSVTRNSAVQSSDADWIFFLDADDQMHPEAFMSAERYMDEHDAIWGNILEIMGGVCAWRYQVPEIRDIDTLLKFDPFLTLGPMGHFVKTEIAKCLPFDDDMDCGEDWDLYLREWKGFKCIKIRDPIIINYRGQHSTGPRSATGHDWMRVVHPMLEAERARREQGTREYWLESTIRDKGYRKGAELGIWYGRTIGHLLLMLPELHMIGVDEWAKRPENAEIEDGETYDDWDMEALERKARKVIDPWGNRGKILKMSTTDAAYEVEDGSLDFVFIDAGHDYKSVMDDIANWTPKVRKGGMVAGHDLDWRSVQKALSDARIAYKDGPDNVWYYFK